jgi:hypothetical protein
MVLQKAVMKCYSHGGNVGTRWHDIPESSSVILLLFELFICLLKHIVFEMKSWISKC